jgi:hypothetical protein
MLRIRDLFVATACCAHDAHNALKWGVGSVVGSDLSESKDLFICVDSVRNGLASLLAEVGVWITARLQFETESWPAAEIVWKTLGVEPHIWDVLVELQLRFHDGRLMVHASVADDPSLADKLSSSLLYVWRLRRYTSSRWLTVGETCRTLVRAMLSGLGDLISFAKSNPKISQYSLHGWERMSDDIRHFVGVCALSSYTPDCFLISVLEDDRVGLLLNELKENVELEFKWLLGLPDAVWFTLAEVCGGHIRGLRSDTISAAHAAHGFF